MNDRGFLFAFGISMAVHMLFLVGQLLSLDWFQIKQHGEIEVVYEQIAVEHELRLLQERLARAKRDTIASPAPSTIGERVQIRIPDRPSLASGTELADIMPDHAAVIDLTNLIDASRGDPVLLSYFGAIRQQIQWAANTEEWLGEQTGEGLVFVSFILTALGELQETTIVAERSVDVQLLWEVAQRIVQTAAPFPPFPPSIAESHKTIVVPLEFLSEP